MSEVAPAAAPRDAPLIARWSLVVPVKPLAQAKSRLRQGLADQQLQQLTTAMLYDTLDAVIATPGVQQVIVVSRDPRACRFAEQRGAVAVAEPLGVGLNAAIEHGESLSWRRWPGNGLAVCAADHPALTPAELAEALRSAAGSPRAAVSDAQGSGTALLTARPGTRLRPEFGPGSAAAHAGSRARMLPGHWPGLRCDVDTPSDLKAAHQIGLGDNTAAVLNGPLAVWVRDQFSQS